MQQIKDSIHQIIYESKSKESVLQRQEQLINYWDIVIKWLSTNFKFIKQRRYVLSDEDHIFKELRKIIKSSEKYLTNAIQRNIRIRKSTRKTFNTSNKYESKMRTLIQKIKRLFDWQIIEEV